MELPENLKEMGFVLSDDGRLIVQDVLIVESPSRKVSVELQVAKKSRNYCIDSFLVVENLEENSREYRRFFHYEAKTLSCVVSRAMMYFAKNSPLVVPVNGSYTTA